MILEDMRKFILDSLKDNSSDSCKTWFLLDGILYIKFRLDNKNGDKEWSWTYYLAGHNSGSGIVN